MGVVPASRVAKIEYCENHVALWTTNAVAMGSSSATITAWSAKVTAARNALSAQKTAQIAAKNATISFNLAMKAMTDATSEVILQVRTKAAAAGDGVYALAGIPVPATPTPKAPPGTPYEPKLSLGQDGALTITWKCDNPIGASGTMYQVYRRSSPSASYVLVGGSGERSFTDETIPAGATQLTYKIQGVRSTNKGQWAEFNVNFGTNANGVMFASLGATPMKLAA